MRDWITTPDGETDEAHITPERFLAYRLERLGIAPETHRIHPAVVLTFQKQIEDVLVRETGAVLMGNGFSTQTDAPFYAGTLDGVPMHIQRLPVGAPMAVVALEMLIASGATTFVLAGIAGSLSPDAPIGGIVIPTGAVREEGTSYHYLPPDSDPMPDAPLVAALQRAAVRREIVAHAGRVWTTDAIYREMGWKVRQYAAAGVLAVEMELSALLAVAQVRGVRLAAVLTISDELFRPWNPGWHNDAFDAGRRAAAALALDALRAEG